MATPLSISTPQLREKQMIEGYEPLFIAAVSTYLVTEGGRAVVLKRYNGRREADRVMAVGAFKNDSF